MGSAVDVALGTHTYTAVCISGKSLQSRCECWQMLSGLLRPAEDNGVLCHYSNVTEVHIGLCFDMQAAPVNQRSASPCYIVCHPGPICTNGLSILPWCHLSHLQMPILQTMFALRATHDPTLTHTHTHTHTPHVQTPVVTISEALTPTTI
jgi:hypothetical protein